MDLRTAAPNEDILPNGWAVTTVESLAANALAAITDGPFGSNLKSDHYTDGGPRVIRLQNIGDGVFLNAEAHISEEHFESLRKHEACTDDVVVAMLGEQLPRACLVPIALGPAIVKADCVRLRVHPEVAIPSYVMAGLNSQTLRRQAAELMHGVGRPRLGLQWFRGLRFPIAPLHEQQRIVEAIESYFTRLDDAVAMLERVERNLKRYRASVLKSAVEGRLVPTEAALAKQEGRDYEPASVLLERILTERRRRWSESGKKGKYQEPKPPDTTNLSNLPEGWCWATIEQVSCRVTVGHVGSMQSEYIESGIPFLRSQNVRENRFDPEGLRFVSDEFHHRLEKSALSPGDTLIVRSGSVGISCVVPDHLATANCSDLVIVKRPLIEPHFVAFFMNSLAKRTVRAQQVGIALVHFNTQSAAALSIPVPPLAEQVRIVAEVGRILSVIDDADKTIKAQLARSRRLRQSILKWAFEGKLADQDPNDEPASVLLERIKAERETAKPVKMTRPPRVAAKRIRA